MKLTSHTMKLWEIIIERRKKLNLLIINLYLHLEGRPYMEPIYLLWWVKERNMID